MKITSIIDTTDFSFNNDTFIALQSKTQSSNIQIVKIVMDGIYVEKKSNVKLYRISLNDFKMYMDSEGTLNECIEKLDSWANVYSFKNFSEFYKWYNDIVKK